MSERPGRHDKTRKDKTMFCSKCGSQINGTMKFCAKCGAPVQGQGGQPAPVARGEIKSHMVGAILQTVVCIPAGIVPLIYACKVNSLLAQGDIAGAQEASKKAKFWINLGTAIVGALIILWILAAAVGPAVSKAQKRAQHQYQEQSGNY